MRLKPDAILQQTDGHRKPPRSEPSPPRSCCYGRSMPEVDPPEPRRKQPEVRVEEAINQIMKMRKHINNAQLQTKLLEVPKNMFYHRR